MNFLYTIDANAEEPIMLINRHIGYDEVEGYGIMGDQFQAELLALDTMGKKRIQVWINSVGGIVMDGYNIYNAILKSKTKVDTYCVGIAASIAAVIFQAGRNRIMADYGVLMYHNPHGSDDAVGLEAMRQSIVKMVATRSGRDEQEIARMMDRTTWISAFEAKEAGLCDVVEASAEQNRKRMSAVSDAVAKWEGANNIINKVFEKRVQMRTIANKLGLNPEASEDVIAAAVDALCVQNRAAQDRIGQIEAEKAKAESDLLEARNRLQLLENEKAVAERQAVEAENAARLEKANNMIRSFAEAGRIKNDEATIRSWTAKAVEDFEGVKALIEGLPVNKQANSITVAAAGNSEADLTSVVARAMAARRAN